MSRIAATIAGTVLVVIFVAIAAIVTAQSVTTLPAPGAAPQVAAVTRATTAGGIVPTSPTGQPAAATITEPSPVVVGDDGAQVASHVTRRSGERERHED